MSRIVPTLIATEEIAAHPVLRAWGRLHDQAPVEVLQMREGSRTKPPLFRLAFGDGARTPVFAKHFRPGDPAHERRVFEYVLPRLEVSTPPFHGACDEPSGGSWMFVEDVGEDRYAPHDTEQRALAAQWLGRMHGQAASLVGSVELPEAGPERYRDRLHSGRAQILEHRGNPALTREDHAVLAAVLECGEKAEAMWPALARACARFPVTLVHGDFQPKNLRLREEAGATVLRPIDWETAGWGVPAADLAFASVRRPRFPVDPEVYGQAVREYLPELDQVAIERLGTLGRVFQAVGAIDWACSDLRFRDPLCLSFPISCMRIYVVQLGNALEALDPWVP